MGQDYNQIDPGQKQSYENIFLDHIYDSNYTEDRRKCPGEYVNDALVF